MAGQLATPARLLELAIDEPSLDDAIGLPRQRRPRCRGLAQMRDAVAESGLRHARHKGVRAKLRMGIGTDHAIFDLHAGLLCLADIT
jgi:hypothetical protein